MFESATVKLTGWYLLIIMVISVVFSGIIYTMASGEVSARLVGLQRTLENDDNFSGTTPDSDFLSLRTNQEHKAELNLFFSLIYANIMVLLLGGAGSYLLAKQTLKPIQDIHEAQSRFVSDASHELRTPLAVMRTELEVALREKKISQKDMQEILTSNLEEVKRLTTLSQTLLQLSRLNHNELPLTPTSLTDLVDGVVKRSDKVGQRIAYDRPKYPLFVQGNTASLEELIVILVDNALKYSPDSSKVRLNITTKASRAVLTIENDGKGISADDLPHIFDRFYRADNSRTSSESSGFGLGLALAKKIVELHRGELSASSAPNQATTFTVKFSLITRTPTPKESKIVKK